VELRRAIFADAKAERASGLGLALEGIAGLPQQIGDVDGGERVRTFNSQHRRFSCLKAPWRAQRRQRAFEAAQAHHFSAMTRLLPGLSIRPMG